MVSRYRSSGGWANAPLLTYRTRYVDCANTSWNNGSLGTSLLVGERRIMTDVVTPGFRRKQGKGEVVFNPMTYEKQVSGYEEGSNHHIRHIPESCAATHTHYEVEYLTGPWIGYWLNTIYPTPATVPVSGVIPGLEQSDLATEVTTKCLAERGKADNNLFESVAEYKQTLSMLRRPQDSLFRYLNKNGEKIRKLSPESAWLAYRYGVRPFIKDVQGIIEGLGKTVGNKRSTTRAKGSIQRSEITSANYNIGNPVVLKIQKQTIESIEYRATSLDEYVADTASNIGFTAKGLLTLPWELVPYSFVADWFVNVGDFLNALAPAPGYKQLGSCITKRHSIYCLYTVIQTTATGNYQHPPVRSNTASCYGSLETKTRTSLGTPGLVIKNDFKLNDAVRAADATALLKQRMDRLFKR